ncbi:MULTISPECIES: hypothetical protein [unclassified Streptomyces]|uniref:hypothetical protein n=1 Tax=unclassified Streptomyces TaxID=2593676 RepID=UPI000DAE4253|nr:MULTISPECIES: hypothetical protein [unclassified Streptomyces]PZT72338.1 hypothetical protein DNK55_27715 [Streptomyces sp. AC1-42T]
MSNRSVEEHFASAAERHFRDAEYLRDDGRWPNADHHLGFAAECALKSLLLLFTEASLDPKNPKKPDEAAKVPWVRKPTGGVQEYKHLPWSETELAVLAHGPLGSRLLAALGDHLDAFANWTEEDRYRHCEHITEETVAALHEATLAIVTLHQNALINGSLS